MWTLAASLIEWALGLLGFGKPDPYAQGLAAGKTVQANADAQGELNDISKADAARTAVSDDSDAILHDPANAGPAKP